MRKLTAVVLWLVVLLARSAGFSGDTVCKLTCDHMDISFGIIPTKVREM